MMKVWRDFGIAAAVWLFIVVLAFALGLGGCAFNPPLTPGQQEVQARQRAAQGVVYCEVFAGHRDCKLIDRSEIQRILRSDP